MKRSWLVLAVVMAMAGTALADEVRLKDGNTLKGRISLLDEAKLTIQTAYGPLTVPRADIVQACIGEGGGPVSSAPAPAAKGGQGLLAAYGFDGSAKESNDRFNGKIAGSPAFVADRQGREGRAIRFTGNARDQVKVAHDPALTPAQMTVSAWVTANDPKRWARIMQKFEYSGKKGYALAQNERTHCLRFEIFSTKGTHSVAETKTPAAKAWQHVAATLDGKTVRIYLNGKLENEAPAPDPIAPSATELTIGNGYDGANYFPWSGDIDEVKIFDRALTPEEIMALAAGTDSPANTTDLMKADKI